MGTGSPGQGRDGAVSHRSRSSGARRGSGPAAPAGGSGPGSAPGSPWRPRRVGPGLGRSVEALKARPSSGTGQASVPPLKAAAGAGISRDGASSPSRASQHGASRYGTSRAGMPSPARVGAQPTPPTPRGARPCQEPNLPRALPSMHQARRGRVSPCQAELGHRGAPSPGSSQGSVPPWGTDLPWTQQVLGKGCKTLGAEELPGWEPLWSLLQAPLQPPGWEITLY